MTEEQNIPRKYHFILFAMAHTLVTCLCNLIADNQIRFDVPVIVKKTFTVCIEISIKVVLENKIYN